MIDQAVLKAFNPEATYSCPGCGGDGADSADSAEGGFLGGIFKRKKFPDFEDDVCGRCDEFAVEQCGKEELVREKSCRIGMLGGLLGCHVVCQDGTHGDLGLPHGGTWGRT